MTDLSPTLFADERRSPTPWPRGHPRQAVLDRIDDLQKNLEKNLDQLTDRLSELSRPGSVNSQGCSRFQFDWAKSNLPLLTSGGRLPLSEIVFTVSVTAYVTITTLLSVAFMLR